MNKTFIEEMRTRLDDEKKQLELELSKFAHRNPKAATTDFDTDFPEPECSVCGRVIYCGASTLCSEKPCGLQKS